MTEKRGDETVAKASFAVTSKAGGAWCSILHSWALQVRLKGRAVQHQSSCGPYATVVKDPELYNTGALCCGG